MKMINEKQYNTTLDHRLLSKDDGISQIKDDFKQVNKNMNTISKSLPNENSENNAEARAGYIWNIL